MNTYPRNAVRAAKVVDPSPEIMSQCDGYQIMVEDKETQLLDCTNQELIHQIVDSLERITQIQFLTLGLDKTLKGEFHDNAAEYSAKRASVKNDPKRLGTVMGAVNSLPRPDLLLLARSYIDEMEDADILVKTIVNEIKGWRDNAEIPEVQQKPGPKI